MSDLKIPLLTNDYCAEHAKDIEKILQRAVDHALSIHRRLGNPIATLRDGKVVIVPPEEIVLSSEVLTREE
jgi:hypothetical protein